jgi:type IV secretion system protein VirB11
VTAVGHYFSKYFAALDVLLEREDITDLYINRAQEVWIETLGGGIERHQMPDLNAATLTRLSQQIAALSAQGISREHPLLSATLPNGTRIQIVAPPATRGDIAIAIRKHVVANISLSDYDKDGAFETVQQVKKAGTIHAELASLAKKQQYTQLLAKAVKERQNILISGGTSTGKTTFLNALIKEIDTNERLILIEDAPELYMAHKNAIGLVAARSALGEAMVSMEDLLNASLRMRPDRIILGELRGPEAFTFLRSVNTGHPGSMTTIHADSPERAIDQLALLVLQSGTSLDRLSIEHYIRSSIDVYVQLGKIAGKRLVTDVLVKP